MRQAGWLGGVRGASNHGATARAGLHLRQLITPPSALLKNQVLLQSFSASSLHALAVGLERARRVQAEWACRTLQPPGAAACTTTRKRARSSSSIPQGRTQRHIGVDVLAALDEELEHLVFA
jgi:hypothetical protein